MKIVISGSGGIGKTTLINHISSTLEYSVIPDYIDVILKEKGYRNLGEPDDNTRLKIRIEALERKIKAETESSNFISDKGVIDYLAYWMVRSIHRATKEQTDYFLENVFLHVDVYDKVIIPPFGRFLIKNNKKRTTDRTYQQQVHETIITLYNIFGLLWEEYALDLNKPPEEVIKELGIE